jgi:5-methylcytosine-specific restriction endonuclease McrA
MTKLAHATRIDWDGTEQYDYAPMRGYPGVRIRTKRPAEPRPADVQRRDRMVVARSRGTHTAAEWRAVLADYGHRCAICGCGGKMTKDHKVPVSRGGSDAAENLQPLCPSCNSRKGNRDM